MRLGTLLTIAAVCAATLVVPVTVSAADGYDFRVQAGARPPDGVDLPFSYTRFYPEQLRVHRGQTVLFDTFVPKFDLYTVSFRPGGEEGRRPAWRRDDGLSGFALNEPIFERSACGGTAQAPCVVASAEDRLSSGLPIWETTWRVRIDRPAGTGITYFCNVHPGMHGSIEVVDDATALPTQDEIDAATRDQIAADTREAIDHQAKRDTEHTRRIEDGRSIWTVHVGDSTPSRHVSIMAYMPSRLDEVQPGDAVEFVSSGAGHHAVTFPRDLVGGKDPDQDARLSAAVFHPECDFDDPEHGAPGIPGLYAPLSPVVCPAAFELVLSPWAFPHHAPNDQVLTPATYHDSGIMWSEEMPESARGLPAGSGNYFPGRFVAEFPVAGPFSYACMVHGSKTMQGWIDV
jgi:plastocyanin